MTKSESKKTYDINDIKKYLIDRFKYDEETANSILASSGIKSKDLIATKLDDIISFLGAEDQTMADYIRANPKLLNCSYDLVLRKYEFYSKRYKLTKAEYCKMVIKSFTTLASSTETAIAKEDFCLKYYGFTLPQYIKAIKTIPSMIGTSEATHRKSYADLHKEYGITLEELGKMVRTCPPLSVYPVSSYLKREKFLAENFGITREQFTAMIKTAKPMMYSEQNFLDTYAELNKKHGFTKEEFARLLVGCPGCVGFNKDNLAEKISKIFELGISRNELLSAPKVLTMNADQMKIRYMLTKINGCTTRNFLLRDFMCNEERVYARMQGLKLVGKSKSNLYISEPKFNKNTKLNTEDLIAQYPFTQAEKKDIEAEYNSIFVNNPLHLTQKELEI